MNLPDRFKQLLTRKTSGAPQVMLAVAIGIDRVVAVSWSVAGETLDIFGQGSASFSDLDDLPETVKVAADLAMSGKEPQQFFIGVPPEWIEEGQLFPDKTNLVKMIASRLELPLGGIVPSLAVFVSYLKTLKIPTTAVLVEIGHSHLRASLIRAGQVLGTRVAGKQEDELGSLEQALSKLGVQPPYPSRLLIYGENDLSSKKEAIMQHSWPEGFFSHLPKVTVLEEGVLAEAVAFASAINLARAGPEPHEAQAPKSEARSGWAEHPEGEEIGFQFGQDKIPPRPRPEPVKPASKQTRSSRHLPNGLAFLLALPARLLGQALRLPTMVVLPRGRGKLGIFLGSGLLVAVAAGLLYLYVPRAKITLMIEAQTLSDRIPLLIGAPQTAQPGEKIIEAIKEEAEVEGSKERNTTGTKLVGDPAKGEVTVFNKTLIAKTFAAETVLVGANGLRFTLDSPVTVGAAKVATSSGSETKTYGAAKVTVTAVNFGEAGNLPAGSSFSFLDYSEGQYTAESTGGFSGGSSREIRVVSQQDHKSLASDLETELKRKAREALLQRLGSDREVIEEGIELKIVAKEFDAEVGEEVDKVRLTAKAKATAYLYRNEEVTELVRNVAQERTPEGYRLETDRLQTEVAYRESRKNGLLATVEFTAVMLPDLDLEAIKKPLLGQSPETVKARLSQNSQIKEVKIEIWPRWLPSGLLRLPRFADKIEIQLTAV